MRTSWAGQGWWRRFNSFPPSHQYPVYQFATFETTGKLEPKCIAQFFLASFFLPSPAPILNLSTSPLKSVFDLSQLSGSINVHDGGTMSFLKTNHWWHSKIRLFCRLGMHHFSSVPSNNPKTGCRESQFYSLPFRRAVASYYHKSFQLAPNPFWLAQLITILLQFEFP